MEADGIEPTTCRKLNGRSTNLSYAPLFFVLLKNIPFFKSKIFK